MRHRLCIVCILCTICILLASALVVFVAYMWIQNLNMWVNMWIQKSTYLYN